jgi:hypothetical protein
MTISELLAEDRSADIYGDPATAFSEYKVGTLGERVRVYHSQPICSLADGDFFPLDEITVKISDFGKG